MYIHVFVEIAWGKGRTPKALPFKERSKENVELDKSGDSSVSLVINNMEVITKEKS